MKNFRLKSLILFTALVASNNAVAEEQFSVGIGYPYLLVSEVRTDLSDDSYLYGEAKFGLDSGFNVGYQYQLTPYHGLGFSLGAVDVTFDCRDQEEVTFEEAFDCVFSTLNAKTSYGANINYIFSFNPASSDGLQLRLNAGAGKSDYTDGFEPGYSASITYTF